MENFIFCVVYVTKFNPWSYFAVFWGTAEKWENVNVVEVVRNKNIIFQLSLT